MSDKGTPNFQHAESAFLWQEYLNRVSALTRALASSQRRDIVAEVRAHLFESMLEGEGTETDRLRRAQDRLGAPEEFVPGWVEERLLQSSDPGLVMRSRWQLMRLNALRGVKGLLTAMLQGLGYMLVFYSFLMAGLKPFFPDNIGLFSLANGAAFVGYADGEGLTELLGWWFIPVMLLLGSLIFWLLNRSVHSNRPDQDRNTR